MKRNILFTITILALLFAGLSQRVLAQTNQVDDAIELAVLKQLYDSLGGSTWTNKTGWPTPGNWPATATATQMDAWFGIGVSNGDITQLQFGNNNLTGKMPQAISQLKAMTMLVLPTNKISALPSSINQLTKLQEIWFSGNTITVLPDFTGVTTLRQVSFRSCNSLMPAPLPAWIFNQTNLVTLDLANCKLTGGIPNSISNLTELLNMDLSSNQLTSIPSSIGSLSKLTSLYLNSNQLSGSIPGSIGNLTKLTIANLSVNQLSGPIPSEIGNLTALTNLYAYSNQLSGSIPASMGNLTKLNTLYLYGNILTGSIPNEIGNLTLLTDLRLYSNKLTGLIPTSIGNLTKLNSLYLHSNQLSGSIPSSLGNATSIVLLSFAANQLSGSIPASMSSLTKLTQLYLNDNKLSGTLPDNFFAGMTNLGILSLANNQMSGTIPTSLGNRTALGTIDLSGNKFSGSIPSTFSGLINIAAFNVGSNQLSGDLPNNLFSSWTKVTTITLRQNNFTGPFPSSIGSCPLLTYIRADINKFTSLPSTLLNLGSLNTLFFTDNDISSIPDFGAYSNKANLILTFYSNRLDFSQMELLVNSLATGLKNAFYSPQKTINDTPSISLTEGSPLVISTRPTGSFSTVTWEKQAANGSWSTISNDQDTNPQTYTRTSATSSDEGIYRWKMTNTKVTGVTLYSDPIQVKAPARFALDNWAFQYKYDGRKRMTHKKVPGADWVYMVYDDRDRLVMTQDGEQRKTNKWSFTKYDELNRPILTGIRDTTVTLTQAEMQSAVNLHFAKASAKWGETYIGNAAGNVHGYSNKAYPVRTGTTTTEINVGKFLTVTYYDNYAFRSLWSGSYNYLNENLSETVNGVVYNQPATEQQNVLGQVTGFKTRLLDAWTATTGGGTWLKSITYYDDKYRVIQTLTDNYKGGTDRTTNVLDFTGKILSSKNTHVKGEVTWKDAVAVTVLGNNLTNSSPSPGWGYSGAASVEQLAAGQNGWVEVTVGTGGAWVVGLSDSNPDTQLNSVDFGISVNNGLFTCENAATFGNCVSRGAVAVGDVLRVAREGSAIKYYKNGTLVATSAQSSTSALMVDITMYAPGHSLNNVSSSFSQQSSTVGRTFKYDHAGRLLKTLHSLNGASAITLTQNQYNELGQLIDKKLHSTNGTDFKQSIDYRYNIRGWLTSINDSQLLANANNDDTNDLFGMNLAYNESIGTGNGQEFNGNISGIKWNNYLAKGTIKERAYNFGYDAMSRLQSASHKENPGAWASSPSYHEDNLKYDLNGNIQTLNRKGSNGSVMDVLNYNYGTGDLKSNQLLSVTDGGDIAKGFADGNMASDDYTYDANGNMVIDKNKAIITSTGTAGITYNYLNLPDKVTKSTGDYIKYIYDATGKKLSQQVYNPVNTLIKKTDYVGEYIYENDQLQFINHEEGRITKGSEARQLVPSPQLLPNSDANTTSGFATNGVGSATLSNETIGTETYLKVVSNIANAYPGFITNYFTLKPGKSYQYRVKGYTTTTPVYLYVYAEVVGNLVWLTKKLPSGSGAEAVVTADFTVPANVTQVRFGALWNPAVIGETMYVNKVELYEVDPVNGLFIESDIPGAAPNEYQYYLKDHLGNVRTTFTTKDEIEDSKATVETANADAERSKFINYDQVRRVNSFVYDHTNNASDPAIGGGGPGNNPGGGGDPGGGLPGDPGSGNPTGDPNALTSGGYAIRLSGNAKERIGLARSLSVMPGDKIDIEVFAKYYDPSQTNTPDLDALMSGIADNGTGLNAGTIMDGTGYTLAAGTFLPFINALTKASGTDTAPKAYLNWAVFDRNYIQDLARSGYKRITVDGREDGTNKTHDWLKPNGTIEIAEPGYVYIWLSNENETPVEVYFDDFKVTQTKSPIIQTQDYYPFGLTFNSYQRENATPNMYHFNGKEIQDELNLGWMDYGARMYQPELGKFSSIDSRSHNYMSYSPYGYVVNNPVNNVDFNGDFILPKEFLNRFQRIAQYLAHDIQGILNNKRIVSALKEHSGYSDKQLKKIFTWGQGPTLNPEKLGGKKFDLLGETKAILLPNSFDYVPGSAHISINVDLFEALEVAEGKDRDYLLFLTAVTILHELVHYGTFENNLIKDSKSIEEGNDFEKDAYGSVIRMSTGTYKGVLDNWSQKRNQSNGGSSSSTDLYFYNSGGTTNSEGGTSTKKRKKPDADREAAKRSGGGY